MHEVTCRHRIARRARPVWQAVVAIVLLAATANVTNAIAQTRTTNEQHLTTKEREALDHLVSAYPDSLLRIDGTDLIWRDGTRMPVHDGNRAKTAEQRLQTPDILDMLRQPYIPGPPSAPPQKHDDSGRARNAAFFEKLYGDCRRGETRTDLVDVIWLPKTSRQRLKMTKRNGAAARLQAISDELDALPTKLHRYLSPPGGTYNCRTIAGTKRLSAHGYGIAIDINVKHSNYWRWSKPDTNGMRKYKNAIPWQIVEIFEKHGFIWGGKWAHFDTMHFEYRPELLPPAAGTSTGSTSKAQP